MNNRFKLLSAKAGFPGINHGATVPELEALINRQQIKRRNILRKYPPVNKGYFHLRYALPLYSDNVTKSLVSQTINELYRTNKLQQDRILQLFHFLSRVANWSFLPVLKSGMLFVMYHGTSFEIAESPECSFYTYLTPDGTLALDIPPYEIYWNLPNKLLEQFHGNVDAAIKCYGLYYITPTYIDVVISDNKLSRIIAAFRAVDFNPYKLDVVKLFDLHDVIITRSDELIYGFRVTGSSVTSIPALVLCTTTTDMTVSEKYDDNVTITRLHKERQQIPFLKTRIP